MAVKHTADERQCCALSLDAQAMLGGVDADDREVLTAYFLDTGTDYSIRFSQRLSAWFGFALDKATSSDVVRHVGFSVIEESKGLDLNFPLQQSKLPTLRKKYFGDLKRHTWTCSEQAANRNAIRLLSLP